MMLSYFDHYRTDKQDMKPKLPNSELIRNLKKSFDFKLDNCNLNHLNNLTYTSAYLSYKYLSK